MTITSNGYGGSGQSINTTAWATLSPHSGAAPHVISGLGATVTSAVNRTVQIGTGSAQGWGIYDQVTAAETVTLDSASSTTPRWDAIVLHRDWATNSGQTTLEVVKGTVNSAKPVYPSTLDANPGTVADHVLWLVPVTNTGAGTPVRAAGLLWTPGSPLYDPYGVADVDPGQFDYGQTIFQYQPNGVQNNLWLRRGTDSDPVLDDMFDPGWLDIALASGLVAFGSNNVPSVRISGGMVELAGIVKRANGTEFLKGGGVDGDYDIGNFPSVIADRIKGQRRLSTSSGNANITVIYNASYSGIKLRATIYGTSAGYINLDALQFRLT